MNMRIILCSDCKNNSLLPARNRKRKINAFFMTKLFSGFKINKINNLINKNQRIYSNESLPYCCKLFIIHTIAQLLFL